MRKVRVLAKVWQIAGLNLTAAGAEQAGRLTIELTMGNNNNIDNKIAVMTMIIESYLRLSKAQL